MDHDYANGLEAAAKWERRIIRSSFILYLLFQINAAFHHGSFGQDFPGHRAIMSYTVPDIWKAITTLIPYQTDPPMMYVLGALVYRLSRGVHYFELIALIYVALNAVALWYLYRLLCALISQPLFRVSCMMLILFLPVFMIQAEVYAGDGLAFPLFIFAIYNLYRVRYAPTKNEFWRSAILLAVSLTLGITVKFTFAAQIATAIIALAIFGWDRCHSWTRLRSAMLLILILPGSVAGFYIYKLKATHVNTMHLFEYGSEFTLMDFFVVHKADKHVLDAPPYNEVTPGSNNPKDYNLLARGRFSYPALLQLGIFTDLVNVYQYDPTDSYFGTRSAIHQRRMRRAMRSSVIIFFSFLILTPITIGIYLWRGIIRRDAGFAFLAALSVLGLVWFFNIVAFFPIVPAYTGGHWTPRLIMPALLTFFVVSATMINCFLAKRSMAWSVPICLLFLYQSFVHLSFLWPWGVMKPY